MSTLLSPGSTVGGRYRIDREIGRGGMAVVYAAWDERHSRHVAIKVLSAATAAVIGVDRFIDEIRTTAGLSHPHILALLDSGSVGESPFYVMPLVRGESLRDRLAREKVLEVDEAMRIGSVLAGALAHAHAEGVIHRDVKPGNVLLDRAGNPYLADFGIARALSASADTQRTSPGQVLGSFQYTSPEQLTPGAEIDGATDVYSLGCLLFEALVGTPPFTVSSTRALAAAHLLAPPPSLRSLRADVPRALDELVQSCVAKDPLARVTATLLSQRLEDLRAASRAKHSRWRQDRPSDVLGRRPVGRKLAYAATAAFVVGAVAIASATLLESFTPLRPPLDSVYAVLPFELGDSLDDVVPIETLLEDALGRWTGITVVDGLRVEALVAEASDPRRLSLDDARAVARVLRSGRYLTGTAQRVGDSVRVEATLRDPATSNQPLQRVSFTVGLDARIGDARVAAAAMTLLFGPPGDRVSSQPLGTMSVPAGREFALGQRALEEWNLNESERRFEAALVADPYFDLAALWKAIAMNWRGDRISEWAHYAQRAARASADWPERDRLLATALQAMASDAFPEACRLYDALLAGGTDQFAAWFGLGECHGDDPYVVPDPNGPTGWSFRGSAHFAANAYRRAFQSLPSSYRAFGAGTSALASDLLYTRRGVRRSGRIGAGLESRPFYGYQQWQGDTLAFVAVPADSTLYYSPDPVAAAEALVRQRRTLLDVTRAWVEAFPNSSGAIYAVAAATELVGDAGALASYRRARQRADESGIYVLAGTAEVFLSLRLYLPDNLSGIRAAVALGDSILAAQDPGTTVEQLAALAVLLGRPARAAALERSASGGGIPNIPPEVVREANALVAFASAGGPLDSIRAAEAQLEQRIRQMVPRAGSRGARQALLELPSLLAFPTHRLAFLDSASLPRGAEARALAALVAGSDAEALEILGESIPGAPWDIVLARAHVLVAAGLAADALALLQSRLGGLSTGDPAEFRGAARLGSLVRAVALRAELEDSIGSRDEAIRWAAAADALWSRGEPAADPLLGRMRRVLDGPQRP
jgi:serine/threonine protein kinase